MKDKTSPKPTDPRRIDPRTLARTAGVVAGTLSQVELPRLSESIEATVPALDVSWSARGEERQPLGGEPQVWLHLQAQTQVSLVCQRCLKTLPQTLDVARSFLFVADEDKALKLDEELEDDVLMLPSASAGLDLQALLEDELILALPIVPRHDVCPDPLPQLTDEDEPEADDLAAAHPFAALAALKKPPRPN